MDDIIIRNNAEEYYEGLDNITIEVENEPNSIVEAYIEGARSRDVEIEHLESELKTLSVLLEKNGVIKFANLHTQMELELMRLRNPWVSVDVRLPEHKKPIIFKSGDKAFGGWYNEDMKEFQTKSPDGQDWAMEGVTMWYYQI